VIRSGESVAFFLGAGASAPFGYPTTAEILPRMVERLENGGALFHDNGKGASTKRGRLRTCIETLLPGAFKVKRLPLITDVLSLLDHLILEDLSIGPSDSTVQLQEWRRLVEEAVLVLISEGNDTSTGQDLLQRLEQWLDTWTKGEPGSVSVVTTNYDIAIEYELYGGQDTAKVADRWDFGMSWRDPLSGRIFTRAESPRYRYYKLHGSTNWLRCARCEHVYVNPDGQITWNAFATEPTPGNTCHCGHTPLRTVIVAPSTVRDIRISALRQVWSSALESLRTSHHWIIVGYSLPGEDIGIRSILMRARAGWDGKGNGPRVTLILRPNSPNNEATADRYRALFPDCAVEPVGLDGLVTRLESAT
jgi:hypothetical protein